MNQTHNKFKIFVGPTSADGSIGSLAADVEAFVQKAGVSPKSIGAEFIERTGQVLVSLGYREDEGTVPVRVRAQEIGSVGDTLDFSAIEKSIAHATASESGIICHEIYITGAGKLFILLMSQA